MSRGYQEKRINAFINSRIDNWKWPFYWSPEKKHQITSSHTGRSSKATDKHQSNLPCYTSFKVLTLVTWDPRD